MKKEHEIPEEFRGLITDAEKEKKVKELFEKANGLDHVKGERAKVQEEYKAFKQQAEPILKIAERLGSHLKRNDLTSYFETLGFTKDQVFKWAIQQAELEQLPKEQKLVYDQQRAAEARAFQLEQQLQEQTQTTQGMMLNQRSNEIEWTLSNPSLSSFVSSFDQRNGEGAFRSELIARGQTYWHTQGIDVPPHVIAQEIMQRFGMPTQQQPVQASNQAAVVPSHSRDLPTIPNTGNSTGSPAKRKMSSIADIEKAYKDLA